MGEEPLSEAQGVPSTESGGTGASSASPGPPGRAGLGRRSVILGGLGGVAAGLLGRVPGARAHHVGDPQPILIERENVAEHGVPTSYLGPFTWRHLQAEEGSDVGFAPAAFQMWDLQSGSDPTPLPIISTLALVADRTGVVPLAVDQRTSGLPSAAFHGGPVAAEEVHCQTLTVGQDFTCGTVGSAVCSAGSESCVVQSPSCEPDSWVGATCTADVPRNNIRAVVPGNGQFTIHWSRALRADAPVVFMTVDPVRIAPPEP